MLKKLAGCMACAAVGGLIASGTAWADGTVYAMTNQLSSDGGNAIVVYHRAPDGSLTYLDTTSTGGGGSGTQLDPTDSLGSQGGVLVDRSQGLVLAVNTNSAATDSGGDSSEGGDCSAGTITSFKIQPGGKLQLADQVQSGGLFPSSLTAARGLLYVLNAGGPGENPVCGVGPNITGFTVSRTGQMTSLSGSTQSIDPGPDGTPGFLNCDPSGFPANGEFDCGLNPPAFPRSPAQVGFGPGGKRLVVTVKGTNDIYVFPVSKRGTPGAPTVTQIGTTTQPTPFGFAFSPSGGKPLIVAEPFGASATIPAAGASAVSSFSIGKDGSVNAISSHVPSGQTAACWIAIDPSGSYAYVSNNGSSDVSSYTIGAGGQLTLLNADAASMGTGGHPNDLAVASDGASSFLYGLASATGSVVEFQIHADGTLTSLGSVSGLPADAGAQGLAAY